MKLKIKRQILEICATLRESLRYIKKATPEVAYRILCDCYAATESIKNAVSTGFSSPLCDEYAEICHHLQEALENVNLAIQTGQPFKNATSEVRNRIRQLTEKLSSETQIEKTGKVIFFMCAYNTPQKYLSTAVESVLNQSDPDLLLLILDHGSTDGTTKKLLQRYAQKDDRIILFRCEKNGKFNPNDDPIAFAEWKGLWENLFATSGAEYLATIDSDDAYSPNFLEEMYAEAKKCNADIAACGTTMTDESGHSVLGNSIPPAVLIQNSKMSETDFIHIYGTLHTHWGKLFSAKYSKRFFDLFFSVLGTNAGDTLMVLKLMREIKCFLSVPKSLHRYRIRSGSFYRRWPTAARVTRIAQVFIEGVKFAKHYHCFSSKTEHFLELMYKNYIKNLLNLINGQVRSKSCEILQFIRIILDDSLYQTICARNPDFLQDVMQIVAAVFPFMKNEEICAALNKEENNFVYQNKEKMESCFKQHNYSNALSINTVLLMQRPLDEHFLLYRLRIDNRLNLKQQEELIFAHIAKNFFPQNKEIQQESELLMHNC